MYTWKNGNYQHVGANIQNEDIDGYELIPTAFFS